MKKLFVYLNASVQCCDAFYVEEFQESDCVFYECYFWNVYTNFSALILNCTASANVFCTKYLLCDHVVFRKTYGGYILISACLFKLKEGESLFFQLYSCIPVILG